MYMQKAGFLLPDTLHSHLFLCKTLEVPIQGVFCHWGHTAPRCGHCMCLYLEKVGEMKYTEH